MGKLTEPELKGIVSELVATDPSEEQAARLYEKFGADGAGEIMKELKRTWESLKDTSRKYDLTERDYAKWAGFFFSCGAGDKAMESLR